jgi:chemotaxis protein methyltransferase CheR
MTNSHVLEAVVDRVAELLRVRIGLRPDSTMRGRLRRAIRDEASRDGHDLATYVDTLVVDSSALQGLMNRVTVQETAFFRHPEHFEVLARDILPALPQPVKIWSAGCANGQEAFSLAMLLEEQGVDGAVVASDLSTAALQRTTAARYTSRELSGLSPERLARHLTRTGDGWEVNKPIRDRVLTLHHNILDPLLPEMQSCQVVFCRNVLIYLSPDHVRAFLDRIADTLGPTAVLFVGAAETIWQVSDRFKAIHCGGTFVYRQPATSAVSTEDPPKRRTVPTDNVRMPLKSSIRTAGTPVIAGESSSAARAARRSTSQPQAAQQVALLEKAAQEAIAAGDYDAAVVAFRKCAYLAPHDPVAQLHLGLALEAAGDELSAKRAFAAARRALVDAGPEHSAAGLEGYATAELVRLLDSKPWALPS